jgi:hypothetical protein
VPSTLQTYPTLIWRVDRTKISKFSTLLTLQLLFRSFITWRRAFISWTTAIVLTTDSRYTDGHLSSVLQVCLLFRWIIMWRQAFISWTDTHRQYHQSAYSSDDLLSDDVHLLAGWRAIILQIDSRYMDGYSLWVLQKSTYSSDDLFYEDEHSLARRTLIVSIIHLPTLHWVTTDWEYMDGRLSSVL